MPSYVTSIGQYIQKGYSQYKKCLQFIKVNELYMYIGYYRQKFRLTEYRIAPQRILQKFTTTITIKVHKCFTVDMASFAFFVPLVQARLL